MILTPQQIAEILSIISKYHLVFIAHAVGPEVLTPEEVETLEGAGLDLDEILADETYINQAFKFGILSDAIGEANAKQMSYPKFKSFLSSGKAIPLTQREEDRLNVLKYRTYGDVRALGGNISDDVRNIITQEGMEAIEGRGSVRTMALEIGKKTELWNKDLDRISDYVMHTAFNEGRATSMERENRSKRVYFDVYAGSCKHCNRLYLKGGVGSEPRTFSIDELRRNGTNIGKKVADWLATLGPIHPWCRCTINYVPEGYEWNEATRAFDKPIDIKRKVQRRSKVEVTVGDKTVKI